MQQVAFLVAFILVCLTVNANTVATIGGHNFPPYMITNDDYTSCSGPAIDRTRVILAESNIDLEVICASPARVFKLLLSGKIDITINIKSTQALNEGVEFIETPFTPLELMLYTHEGEFDQQGNKSISAIRGFDYHGFRSSLGDKGYTFIDMPDSISAVKMFMRDRSYGLITYRAPFNYYLLKHGWAVPSEEHVTKLQSVDTHYVISDKSKIKNQLKDGFQQYSTKHNVVYLNQVKELVN